MKKKTFLFLMGLIVILAAATGFAAAGKQKLRVKAYVGNIRSEPGKTVIQKVKQGTILEYRGEAGEWYKVDLPPDPKGVVVTGYIHQSLVEFVSEADITPKQVKQKELIKKESSSQPPAQTQTEKKTVSPPAKAAVEKKFDIIVLGGGGATFVDIPKDLEVNENWMEDWDKINWRVTAQGIYKVNSWLGVGGEFGFNTLYYATWQAPGFYAHFVTVTATNFHGLLEFNFAGSFFFQTGMGVFMFSESSGIGFFGALGGNLIINKFLSIPVMVRFDAIPGAPMPLTMILGLRLKAF